VPLGLLVALLGEAGLDVLDPPDVAFGEIGGRLGSKVRALVRPPSKPLK